MLRYSLVFFLLTFFVSHSYAAELSHGEYKQPTTPSDKLELNSIIGVYKKSHKIGIVGDDELYPVEDTLEIIKHSPDKVYIRTSLYFHNGHECNLQGITDVEGSELVFRDHEPCVLRLKFSADKILFDDEDYNCYKYSCGMRGSYNGTFFDRGKRVAPDAVTPAK